MAFGETPSGGAASGAGGRDELSIDALEQEITTLAAHLTSATYRLLVLIEELERRKGWAGWGVKSCADWLSWKCGIGIVAAREKVRVAKALPSLPLVSEAMAAGRLSYSKVRAITRIAGRHNESALLSIAENGTATHVERTVRYYRQTEPKPDLERERKAAVAQHTQRRLSCYWDHDGSLVVEGRLSPEQGALFIEALEAADAALREDAPCAQRQAVRKSASAEARDGTLLRRASPDADASAEALPLTDAPNWGQRQADALTLVAERSLTESAGLSAGDRHVVHVHVDLDALCEDADGGGRRHIENGPALARDVARRLACDGGVVAMFEDGEGHTLDVGRKTRAIPPAMRRALAHRDQGCRFPGCTCSTRYTDAHHIEHWADGGATRLDNLVLLCRYHHRLVHEGGFDLEKRGEDVVFLRPDGRELPVVPKAPALERAGVETLQQKHTEAGLAIDARTAVPGWGGERADYTYMLTMLEQREGRRGGTPAGVESSLRGSADGEL